MIYGFFYRLVMRVAHYYNWHYAPPVYPDGNTQLWCQWCGFRQTIYSRPTSENIFSGDYSRDMWDEINNAKSVAQLRSALYLVCCRLQELESRLTKRAADAPSSNNLGFARYGKANR